MTSRLTSAQLDLSRLPQPDVIEAYDYEVLRQAFIDRFVPLINERLGITYNVDKLESDPAIIIGEALAYLRMLDRARVNDAARAVLVPFALGADLDNLAAFFGVDRVIGEGDESLRARLVAAPDGAATAGPIGAYQFHARTASPMLVKDVGVRSPSPGAVWVSILSAEKDGAASPDLLSLVRARLNREDIKPLTVALTVKSATIVPIDVKVTLLIPTGPDPQVVREQAEKSIRAYAEERHRVGRVWRSNGLIAAAKVAGVEDVVQFMPMFDVDPGPDGTVYTASLTIGVEIGG